MKVPNPGPPRGDLRVWLVVVALEAAKHVIPIIQRELQKRWKNPETRGETMKQQLNLTQLAAELTRQEGAKRDYIASTAAMRVDFTNHATRRVNVGGDVDEEFRAHRACSSAACVSARHPMEVLRADAR